MKKGRTKTAEGVGSPKTRKDYEEAKAFDAACAEQLRRHCGVYIIGSCSRNGIFENQISDYKLTSRLPLTASKRMPWLVSEDISVLEGIFSYCK